MLGGIEFGYVMLRVGAQRLGAYLLVALIHALKSGRGSSWVNLKMGRSERKRAVCPRRRGR